MVQEKTLNTITRVISVTMTSVAACVLLYLFWYHATLVTFPWPIEYREGALLLTTDMMLKGGDPYALAAQPYYANAYGLLYNLIALPFAMIWGPTLLVHRAVAGVFTIFSLLLISFVLYRLKTPWRYLLPALAVMYSCLLFGKTSLVEPASTGVFFYLLSVLIPLLMNFSVVSLGISALLVALVFCVKPYFIVGCVVVALYLLLSGSYRKLFIYGALVTAALTVTAVLLDHYFETYTLNVLLSNYNWGKSNSSTPRMLRQLVFIFLNDKFFLVTALISIAVIAVRKRCNGMSGDTFRYLLVAVAVQLVIFMAMLGKNTGAWATYYYQLSMPLVAALAALSFTAIRNRIALAAVQISLIIAMLAIPGYYPSIRDEFGDNALQWEKARELIATHRNILNSPALVPLLLEARRPVYDSGQTAMFKYGIANPGLVKDALLPYARIKKNMFFHAIASGINRGEFDLLMIDRTYSKWLLPLEPLEMTYEYKGFLTLIMPHNHYRWQIDVWEPKKKAGNTHAG